MNNNIVQTELRNEILLSDDSLKTLKLPEKCGYYVYGLIDPDDVKLVIAGQLFELPFYVGKGCGNRIYDHIKQARNLWSKRDDIMNELKTNDSDIEEMSKDLRDFVSNKIKKIWDILDRGEKLIYVIYRWGLTEVEALKIEATLIDVFPNLTNISGGYDTFHGMTTPDELLCTLNMTVYDEPVDSNGQIVPYIIIKLKNNIAQRGLGTYEDNLYKAVRGCWYIDIKRARKCPYVLAVVNGVVKGVYEVDKNNWRISPTEAPRKEFDGKPTTNETMRKLIGHLIPEKYRKQGMANPIRYSDRKNNECVILK